jgi:heme exporter protein D
MDTLIWIGAALSLAGVAGLLYCVVVAVKAKRAGLQGEALQARLKHVVALNLGAVAVSAIGLMLVVLGIFLA